MTPPNSKLSEEQLDSIEHWAHTTGWLAPGRHKVMLILGELRQLRAENARYRAALTSIQNAHGSPYDEDDVTTTAREALESPDG